MLKHWRYRLEKGRPHLILLIGLLITLIGISVLGGLVVFLSGAGEGLGQSMWWTFLHVSDPGYLGDAEDPLTAIFGTIFTVLGMITFMAGLVGILTSLITSGLKTLREGGAPVAFDNHIVIVGWNSRVYTLIADLLHASDKNQIAILGPIEKDSAEKQLERRVFDPIEDSNGRSAGNRARGSVVYRQGNAGIDHDLVRVSASTAARFVLLAQNNGGSARAIDVAQIRTLYSIQRILLQRESTAQPITKVVEFASEQFRSHAFYAVRANPRLDAWVAYYEERLAKRGDRSFLPIPESVNSVNDMTAVNPDQIVSRVLVQCAVQPFMSGVYDELFSFVGREMFLWQPDQQWDPVWKQMMDLAPKDRPAFLGNLMKEGLVIGSFHGRDFSFSPEDWSDLADDAHYLVLGDKQTFSRKPSLNLKQLHYKANCSMQLSAPKPEYRVLILGINRRFPMIMEQLADYAEQYSDSEVIIHAIDRCDAPEIPHTPRNIEVHTHHFDCTDWESLGAFLEQTPSFDTFILLAEDLDIDDPEVDARVTLILVMLRAFRDDPHWHPRLKDASIVAEVRDPRNRNILHQEDLAGDVIVGDGYVSGFLAQVCMDHRLEELYREILDFGHHEVYSRELDFNDSSSATFGDLVQSCAEQNEIAIGILKHSTSGRPVPLLAPTFAESIDALDRALVIATK